MKRYSKIIDNKLIVKTADEIQIRFNGFMLLSPQEEDILNDGWALYSQDQEDIELCLNNERDNIIRKIIEYDSSDQVNVFYKQNTPMWFDKTTRTSLKLRFELELKNGGVDTILWYNGIAYKMLIEEALKLLESLEMYAIQCYDITQMHINQVKNLNTLDEINSYNYTIGYPQKLYF